MFRVFVRRFGSHAAPTPKAGSSSVTKGFVEQLEAEPRGKVIMGGILATMSLAGFLWAIAMASGTKPHTMSADWKNANQEYMKFQKMNPIFGVSKGQ